NPTTPNTQTTALVSEQTIPLQEEVSPLQQASNQTFNPTTPNTETTVDVSEPIASPQTSEVSPLQQASNQTFNPTTPNTQTTALVSEQTIPLQEEVSPLQQASNQTFNPTTPNTQTTALVSEQTIPLQEEVSPLQPAKGGQVTQLKVDNNQPVAASNTVPAMLKPGKSVINKADTQKNLNLLEYLNKRDIAEDIVQRKTAEQNNYSSPPLIFIKANSNNTSSKNNLDTPSQWSSIETLLNIGNEEASFTNFSSETGGGYNSQTSNNSFPIQQKPAYSHKAIDDNLEKTLASDISPDLKLITETIKSPFDESFNSNSANSNLANSKEDDEIALEALAREVYARLRQQLEIEKERQGIFTGRLPW
ncbi:MAG: hypothetical protein KME46_21725, partial [Brasilonema angustatum HA4187-MV1]|nr:hypothetical protein [Brasilonema angustatum HA4187-MV1]